MNLEKSLRSRKGQSVVEYIVLFIVAAAGVFVVFGAFTPDKVSVQSTFSDVITRTVNNINNW